MTHQDKSSKLIHCFQEEIIIPHDKCGIVIGKSGNTLRNLRSQFGCSVNLDSTVNTGDPKPLRIAGPPEKVHFPARERL